MPIIMVTDDIAIVHVCDYWGRGCTALFYLYTVVLRAMM